MVLLVLHVGTVVSAPALADCHMALDLQEGFHYTFYYNELCWK